MLNPRCPNCNYILVLLSNRRKYKCSKCSRLFPQGEIDAREFRRCNERQRQQDIENLEIKNRKPKLTEEERKQKDREYRTLYYEKNKDKIKNYVREWRNNNKERRNRSVKEYRSKTIEQARLRDRLGRLRQMQKELALQKLKINGYQSYANDLDDSFSTFGLSEVLSFICG